MNCHSCRLPFVSCFHYFVQFHIYFSRLGNLIHDSQSIPIQYEAHYLHLILVDMRPEECSIGLRVVIASRSKHQGKYATITKLSPRRVHVVFDGETKIRWYSANNLNRVQAGTVMLPRPLPSTTELVAPFHTRTNPVERSIIRPTVVVDEAPQTPISPTSEGASNHSILETLRINHAYEHDNDFNNVVSNLVDTLLTMNFGSTTPVLEFLRDKIEHAELNEIDRHCP